MNRPVNSQNVLVMLLFLLISYLIFMIPSNGFTQQIEAEVRLTLERLPLEKQEKLKN